MNIKNFSIEGLFNRFNHRIEFKNNINIIIGKNGVGKTTCLELLYALFNRKLKVLYDIPFQKIELEFKNGEVWTISKKNVLEIRSTLDEESLSVLNDNASEVEIDDEYKLIGKDRFVNKSTGEIVRLEQLPERIKKYLFKTPLWFDDKINASHIKIIQSQRLVEYGRIDVSGKVRPQNKALLNAYNLSTQIKDIIAKASDIASNLDKTFPTRLLSGVDGNKNRNDDLKKNLADLEIKRRELGAIGLIATEPENSVPQTDNISETSANVLGLYVQDSWAKLQPYEAIAQKLSLFVEIINSRFLYKKMTIDKNKGYFFVSDEGEEIPIDKLSSGEQNELVMFYNLLFECNENNLILIDEPEISMHIEWLNNMLPDLIAISKLNGLSMLIATHSPDFIGEYWNLTTELK